MRRDLCRDLGSSRTPVSNSPPSLSNMFSGWAGSLPALAITWLGLTTQAAFGQDAVEPVEPVEPVEQVAPVEQTKTPAAETSAVDLQRARRAFARGVELANEGAFGRAAQKFEEALAIHPAPAVEYNLASALFELHRDDESYNVATHVLQTNGVSPEVRERAEKLEKTLRPRVARLTVVLGGSSEDAVVLVDGVQLAREQIGVTRALRPGRHKVEAVQAGRTISTREIEIPLRTAAFVDVSMIASAEREIIREVIVPAKPEPAPALTKPASHAIWTPNKWLWGGIAALVIAGRTTTGILLWPRDAGAAPKPVSGTLDPGVITWP